ncbi:BREX-1 system adenine-specific DNA-methyltransferase PglX [Levilactobacillus brevis]|nr:BREX-1 system adenine-specific DNA-methyltransferase PglX [Levilactobacillus brevis]
MMKARQYNRRALMPDKLKPNVFVFEDTNVISDEFMNQLPQENRDGLLMVLDKFHNARELGSITWLETNLPNIGELKKLVNNISVTGLDVFGILETKHEVLTTLTIAQVLIQKYEIAVTNPPYLNKMDPDLKKYVKKYYGDYSGDLFSVFIFNNSNLVKTNGYATFMTLLYGCSLKLMRNYVILLLKIRKLIA